MALQTLFLRDFTVLDFAFLSARAGLQGESLHVSAELDGELDAQGFILDFGPAKKILKALVDNTLDHKLVVPALSPALTREGTAFRLGEWWYDAPSEATVFLDAPEMNESELGHVLSEAALARLPANVRAARFYFRSEPRFSTEANFRYTHGLRLHEGNCQRLFHGHRNPVEVWQDGQRLSRAEERLAREWEGVHFAHAETVVNLTELDLLPGRPNESLKGKVARLEYRSPQGLFRGDVPAERIVLLETEPSIENIARLGAARLRAQGLDGAFQVRAYEGLNKGAAFTLD
jgi:6-pyruvoyl-tetrahydropterin synthase